MGHESIYKDYIVYVCMCLHACVAKESTRPSSQKLCVSYRSKAALEPEEVQEKAQNESIDKIGKCIEYICSCLYIIIKVHKHT